MSQPSNPRSPSDPQRPVFASRPDFGAVGSVLDGRYRIEEIIGEGGMGVVAKATDLRLERTVAVKLLHSEYTDQADILERFAREAMVIAKLRSRHVVSVLDVSTNSDNPYLVLEHLEGESLEARIVRDGPLPLGEAVTYCRQVAEALEEAHAVGILHRDIKPANVFLSRQSNREIIAQVLDFGTARFYDAKRDGQLSKPTITKQFETFGSPAYMPPEQISSARNTDERSDIWALGTVLYEALTGRLAFEGEYPEVFVIISTREPPPVRSLRADVPPELELVIERCLRKEKEERYASMTELKRALLSLEQEILPALLRPSHTVPSPPLSGLAASNSIPCFDDVETQLEEPLAPPSGRGKKFALAALLLMPLIFFAVGLWQNGRIEPAPQPSVPAASASGVVAPPPENVQTTDTAQAPNPELAPQPDTAPAAVASASAQPAAAPAPVRASGKAAPVTERTAPPPAVKAAPVVPAGPALPSAEDIGRRK